MVGLVFVDMLVLTPVQWGAVLGNLVGWWVVWQRRLSSVVPTFLLLLLVQLAFWNASTSIDTHLLYSSARDVTRFDWSHFLSEVGLRSYVSKQTPFITFLISRRPVLWQQQLFWLPGVACCVGLLFALYGRHAALICATPLFALMIHQPVHDMWLFLGMLVTLRLVQLRRIWLAALVYGLCFWIKPLVLVSAPVMMGYLAGWMIISVALWAAYLFWAHQWFFGQHQWNFLLHQLFIRWSGAGSI